jgi:phosphodiesterase/alkaline phosphatase D-like protein
MKMIPLSIILPAAIANVCGFPIAAQEFPWPDPIAQQVIPAETAGITHGPMLGRPAATSMRVWIRTAEPCLFRVRYAPSLPLEADAPAVPGQTWEAADNTGYADLRGLKPDTRYYYAIEIDGVLADTRLDFHDPWPSFRTLPDASSYLDTAHNPEGRFNICFSIGCGGCQDPRKEINGGQYPNSPSFATVLREHSDEIQFHFMNGDYTYEELRDGTIGGIRANYKLYMERGRNMSRLQRNVPWLFSYDDHEVEDNLFGVGQPGFDLASRTKYLDRDVQLGPWYEYAGWANYDTPQRGSMRHGKTQVEAGASFLHDPAADFSTLDPDTVSTILVRQGDKSNLGTYGLVEVLDAQRLQLNPAFDASGVITYSIGTHHYYDWKLGNCHFFVLDTRGERSSFREADIRSPKQFLLGETQRRWLIEGAKKSDADFIFVISSTGCVIPHSAYHVAPERGTVSKGDGFPGYIHEREAILVELDALDKPVLFFTGDVHNSLAVEITDNLWEFMAGPMNSKAHPIGTVGNMPFGGWYNNEGRDVKVKWVAGWPNEVHYSRLHGTFYAVVQVNNIFQTAKPEGVGYQYVAYDAPQVVVRFHDAYTGKLLYAEGISTLDVEKSK